MAEELNSKLKRITHNGKSILYCDFRDLSGDELASQIKENVSIALELGARGETRQLLLVDARESYVSKEALMQLKEGATATKQVTHATAVVGVEGIRRHMLDIINRVSNLGAMPFDTLDEAKEWLTKQ